MYGIFAYIWGILMVNVTIIPYMDPMGNAKNTKFWFRGSVRTISHYLRRSTAGTDPGKPTVCELENGPFVVDLPVEHDDFPWLCYLTMENHHL